MTIELSEYVIDAIADAIVKKMQEPNRQIEDYENEIEDLQKQLDIAEYDKERFKKEATIIKEKIKALEREPKKGHWIAIDEEPHEDYECDNCGYIISVWTANIEPHMEYKYCPNCGAKMESEVRNETDN